MFDLIGIDRVILDDYFQRFSNWFQKLTGKDCFFLAYVAVIFFYVTGNIGFALVEGGFSGDILTITLFAAFIFILTIKKSQDIYRRTAAKGQFANPTATFIPFIAKRIAILTSTLFTSSIFIELALSSMRIRYFICSFLLILMCLSVVSFLYLSACTPLPPSRSKLSKWLSNLKESLSFRGSAIHEPAPV